MKLAIVGLGVIGGSLARGWIADGHQVSGWAEAAEDRAAATGAGVRVVDGAEEAAEGADGLVLATPMGALDGLAARLAPGLGASVWIMDVASLQGPPLVIAERHGLQNRWVGAHPLTGSERSGFEASDAHLFAGARVWLSAAPSVSDEMREIAVQIWKLRGGEPAWIDPAEHDRRMAWASHLPQVVSTAVADALLEEGLDVDELGPGGCDVTRLAASSTAMWGELLREAGPEVARALRAVAGRLEEDAAALERGDPGPAVERMERAGPWRTG